MIIFCAYSPFSGYTIFEESEWDERPYRPFFLKCDTEKKPIELSFVNSNCELRNRKIGDMELKELCFINSYTDMLSFTIKDNSKNREDRIIVDLLNFKFKPEDEDIILTDYEKIALNVAYTVQTIMKEVWTLGSIKAWDISQENEKLKTRIGNLKIENCILKKSLEEINDKQ